MMYDEFGIENLIEKSIEMKISESLIGKGV